MTQSGAASPGRTSAPTAGNGRTTAAIQALLIERAGAGRDSLGYVAGMTGAEGTAIVTAGQSGTEDGRLLDGDAVFEIGSVTKVFTALLLADMAARGEVALGDPAAKYLPPEGRPREFGGQPITLLDLATHTSGLPRLPGNLRIADPGNPYADYTVAQLYEALSTEPPRFAPGAHYEYSNLGFGLLGHVLALRAGRGYEELVVSRICDPLGLHDTRITLTVGMRCRLVPGHDPALGRVPNWDVPTLAGLGALRSTANDLLRFLDACLGRRATPLAAALARLLEVRRRTDMPGDVAAEGWFVRGQGGDEVAWKDGGTGGYSSFVGYSPRTGKAAVLLANMSGGLVTRQIGLHLVNPRFPPPSLHRQSAVDAAALARLAGRYAPTPEVVLTVTPESGYLVVQATGEGALRFFPEDELRFFCRDADAQLTFELGANARPFAVVLHVNGRDLRARQQ